MHSGVQVHEVGSLHVQAGGAEDVELHGHVGVVRVLHLGGGLHLDEVPPAAPALEHVHGDEDAVREEGGLEDGRGAAGHGAPGLLQPCLDVPVVAVDEDAAREAIPCDLAHPVPLVEDGLLGGVGRQLRRLGLVHPPPELLRALQAVAVAGLGKLEVDGHEGMVAGGTDIDGRPGSKARPGASGPRGRWAWQPTLTSPPCSPHPRCVAQPA